MSEIPWRVGLQQRVLPAYRAPFFDALGQACPQGLSLIAGQPRPVEAIETAKELAQVRLVSARNLHLFSGGLYFCWQRGLADWLQAWQPQVLILESNPRYLSSPRAIRWARSHNCALIGWGLGAQPSAGQAGRLLRSAWKNFVSQFDALIAYSLRGAEQYAQLGFPAERIVVAPNAVAPRPTQPPVERPPAAADTPLTVLYVGRLQARKRVDLLLRACAALPAAAQPDLEIVGDGPVRAELQALAGQIYPRAHFRGGLYGSELDPFFTRADLFVLPGTGGLAVQQAMSFGLPVIVAEADGTQSNLVRPENGWLLPANDLPALQAALQQALADPARLRAMGQAAYKVVADEVNLETMVAAFSQAIHLAAGRAGLESR